MQKYILTGELRVLDPPCGRPGAIDQKANTTVLAGALSQSAFLRSFFLVQLTHKKQAILLFAFLFLVQLTHKKQAIL